jgi:opacity protein-like surface antigen
MITAIKCAALASALMLTAGSAAWAENYSQNYGAQSNYSSGSGQSSPGTITADTQQRIRQSLEQNGFKNIQVLPEAFVIRAQAPDGSHLAMLLTPDQVTEVVTGNMGSGTTMGENGQTTSQQQAQQELSHYGYTNLQNLTPMRGWVAEATKNGENVRIMLSDNGLVATFPGR